jgi:hypothetical protein
LYRYRLVARQRGLFSWPVAAIFTWSKYVAGNWGGLHVDAPDVAIPRLWVTSVRWVATRLCLRVALRLTMMRQNARASGLPAICRDSRVIVSG